MAEKSNNVWIQAKRKKPTDFANLILWSWITESMLIKKNV